VPYVVSYDLNGPITQIDEEAVKQGEVPMTTISGTAAAYKKIDTGVTLVDIDSRVGRVDLGGGDIMGLYGALNR